jgi:sialate O-acetylesterase
MWRKPKEILDIADQATTDDTWRYRLEARFPDLTPEARASLPKAPQAQMNNTASALFNGKINPLIPFALRGAIWYQGESNVGRAAGYAPLLSALIHDWRTR